MDRIRVRLLLALAVLFSAPAMVACGADGAREADGFAERVRAWPEVAEVRAHVGDGAGRLPYLSATVVVRPDTPPDQLPALVRRVAEQLPVADVADLTGQVAVRVGEAGGPGAERPGEAFGLGFHGPPVPDVIEAEARLWTRFTAALPDTAVDVDVHPDGRHERTVRVPTTSDAVPAALRTAFDTLAATDRPPTRGSRLELTVDGAPEPSYSSRPDLPPDPVREAMLTVAGLRATSRYPSAATNVGWSPSNCGPPYLFASVDATPDEVRAPGTRPGGAYVEALAAAGVPYLFHATRGGGDPFVVVDERCAG